MLSDRGKDKVAHWGVRIMAVVMLAAFLFGAARPAHAQAQLVSASPGPGDVLSIAPTEVRLVFNRPLLEQNTSIRVFNSNDDPIDVGNGSINPNNNRELAVGLPLLFEGTYRVEYVASLLGSSVTLAESYEFMLDLPDPIVDLVSPASGQAYANGAIVPIKLRTQYVDFSAYNRRLRLYVDDQLQGEFRELRTTVEGLSPGVHKIRVVLVQLGDQELTDTSTTVYISVMNPASSGPQSDYTPTFDVSLSTAVGALLLAILMLIAGVALGRLNGKPPDQNGGP
jgi:methionine-rich copper-binding protein CopC